MKNRIAPFLLLFCFCARSLRAQEAPLRIYAGQKGSFAYSRPAFWGGLGAIPSDIGGLAAGSLKKENLPWLAVIGASTLILVGYDQELIGSARRAGKNLNISGKDKTRTYLSVGGVSLFRGPSDLGSALYFIGDGWVNIGLFGYFKVRGLLKDDWRASQTANQLAEGLIATGLVTEAMKNISGRETPSSATGSGGVWRMFPGFNRYVANRTRYDAFPSGHLATGVMTVTILSENYPDNRYIRPVGYALLGGLCFQMMNNGVHWASDYPLGIAVGYGLGKIISRRGRAPLGARRPGAAAPALGFTPYLSPEGAAGAALAYKF